MTLSQWRRLKVFALRMAKVSTAPRWQPRLRYFVARFLDRIEGNGDWPHMDDWDNSQRYDYVSSHTWACGTTTSHRHHGWHPLMCDEVRRFIWDMEDEGELPKYPEREGGETKESVISDQLACCVRAAMDVACAPSAGVMGYTVGHLRRMWAPRRIPAWVTAFFEGDLDSAPDNGAVWL